MSPEAESLVNGLAGFGALLGPVGALIGQIITVSVAGMRFLEAIVRKGHGCELYELLPGLLRTAASEQPARPLVCLVDDADRAEGNWWSNLLLTFAQEVALELPLVLVMSIDGPMQLGEVSREEESDACRVARSLRKRGLGDWWPLGSLSREEVASWLRPASRELVSALWQIAEGDATETRELWDAWEQQGAIRPNDEGDWQIVGPVERTFAEAGDRLSARLISLLGNGDPSLISEVRELLACAALEGSIFTAEALAGALHWDVDALIDLVDDNLAVEGGLLHEMTPVEIPQAGGQTRTLWRYAFTRSVDRRIVRVRFSSVDERRVLAGRLGPALIAAYAPEEHRVAATLARLCSLVGDKNAARRFRRIADLGVQLPIVRAQARNTARADSTAWTREDLIRGAELLLHAIDTLVRVDPYPETLGLARACADLAARAGIRPLEAEASCRQGRLHLDMGLPEQARRDLARAGDVIGARPSLQLESRMATLHADVELSIGDYHKAQAPTAEALRIHQKLGDSDGEAQDWFQLGRIELKLRNPDAARPLIEKSLRIHEEIDDWQGQAACWAQLGSIALITGNVDEARQATETALKISQEIRDRIAEAVSWHQLARVELEAGDATTARALTDKALAIAREMGARREEGSALHQLGEIELELGNSTTARHLAVEALTISREIGNRHVEAGSAADLAVVELTVGNSTEARTWAETALRIDADVGGPCLEQTTRQLLEEIVGRPSDLH